MRTSIEGLHVLVVEDDDDFRRTLADTLRVLGADVDESEGGWPAWSRVQSSRFDVVLTDLRMARGEGLELIERIRALRDGRPAVVAISGHADIVSAALGPTGADAFIAKPFGIAALEGAIMAALERVRRGP